MNGKIKGYFLRGKVKVCGSPGKILGMLRKA